MKNEAAILLLAMQFLTRIPVSAATLYTTERMKATTRYYPLVGFLIGGFCAGVFWLATLVFPSILALVIAVAAGLILTGGFHEDGLADTFDGIGGGQDRAQALRIMKDSRLGTYGTLALVMALILKLGSLAALPAPWIIAALIGAHGLSRLSSVLVIATSTYARDDGTAKPVADGISAASLAIALVSGLIGFAVMIWWLPLNASAAAVIGLVAGHGLMRLAFERKLQGYTGDTLGAVQQASEIGFYLWLAAWAS